MKKLKTIFIPDLNRSHLALGQCERNAVDKTKMSIYNMI